MTKHPVSVCIPHIAERAAVFEALVLPALEAALPAEILIEYGDGTPGAKRNRAASRATQPFLFFLDDDTIVTPQIFARLVAALSDQRCGFAFCDSMHVNYPGAGMYEQRQPDWNPAILQTRNILPAMMMIRAEVFCAVCGFDETLPRYQDWDLALSLAEAGHHGAHVGETLYAALYFGRTIAGSSSVAEAQARMWARRAERKGQAA